MGTSRQDEISTASASSKMKPVEFIGPAIAIAFLVVLFFVVTKSSTNPIAYKECEELSQQLPNLIDRAAYAHELSLTTSSTTTDYRLVVLIEEGHQRRIQEARKAFHQYRKLVQEYGFDQNRDNLAGKMPLPKPMSFLPQDQYPQSFVYQIIDESAETAPQ